MWRSPPSTGRVRWWFQARPPPWTRWCQRYEPRAARPPSSRSPTPSTHPSWTPCWRSFRDVLTGLTYHEPRIRHRLQRHRPHRHTGPADLPRVLGHPRPRSRPLRRRHPHACRRRRDHVPGDRPRRGPDRHGPGRPGRRLHRRLRPAPPPQPPRGHGGAYRRWPGSGRPVTAVNWAALHANTPTRPVGSPHVPLPAAALLDQCGGRSGRRNLRRSRVRAASVARGRDHAAGVECRGPDGTYRTAVPSVAGRPRRDGHDHPARHRLRRARAASRRPGGVWSAGRAHARSTARPAVAGFPRPPRLRG